MDITETGTHKVALVTGAASGIGKEIALTLARNGMAVGVFDLSPNVIDTCNEIQALGIPSKAVIGDVTKEEDVEKAHKTIVEALGPVDVLSNNAGIGYMKPFIETGTAEWEAIFAVNVHGAFFFSRSVLPGMMERRSGVIINMASKWGLAGAKNRVPYTATKHALVGMTRALSEEYKSYGIRVLAVCPGPTVTGMAVKANHEGWMHPGNVADVVAFLCEPAAECIYGTTIEIPGWGTSPDQ